VKKLVDP